jgi:hypothetical protein
MNKLHWKTGIVLYAFIGAAAGALFPPFTIISIFRFLDLLPSIDIVFDAWIIMVLLSAILGALSGGIFVTLREHKLKIAGRISVIAGFTVIIGILILIFASYSFFFAYTPQIVYRNLALYFLLPLIWAMLLIYKGIKTLKSKIGP